MDAPVTGLMIHLDPEIVASIRASAEAEGISVDAYVSQSCVNRVEASRLLAVCRRVMAELNAACEDEGVNHNPHVGRAIVSLNNALKMAHASNRG